MTTLLQRPPVIKRPGQWSSDVNMLLAYPLLRPPWSGDLIILCKQVAASPFICHDVRRPDHQMLAGYYTTSLSVHLSWCQETDEVVSGRDKLHCDARPGTINCENMRHGATASSGGGGMITWTDPRWWCGVYKSCFVRVWTQWSSFWNEMPQSVLGLDKCDHSADQLISASATSKGCCGHLEHLDALLESWTRGPGGRADTGARHSSYQRHHEGDDAWWLYWSSSSLWGWSLGTLGCAPGLLDPGARGQGRHRGAILLSPHTRDIMKEIDFTWTVRHTPELWPECPELGFPTREDTSHITCHIDISHQHVKILNLVYYKCRGKTVKSIAK